MVDKKVNYQLGMASSDGESMVNSAPDDASAGDNWSDEGQSESSHDKIPQSKDIKMINIIRSFVILLMLTIAAITANSVFVYVFIEEENKYETSLRELSHKLVDNFYAELERKMSTARALSTTFTSHSYSTGAKWPFFSLPDFGAQCVVPRQVGQISTVSLSPLVVQSQREAWEAYAAHFAFVALDDGSMGVDPLEEEEASTRFYMEHDRSVEDGIYRTVAGEAVNDTITADLYFPIWQSTPLSPNGTEIMYHPRSNRVREQAILSSIDSAAGACSDVLLHASNRSDFVFYATPRSTIYYPLWESLHKQTIMASLGLEFRWETFFTGVLPESVEKPLLIVLQSSCGGSNYTFEISGTQGAVYRGHGDLQEEVESNAVPIASSYNEFKSRLQEATDQNSTSCAFRITVFPSNDFRQSFLTNAPMYLKLLVGGVFFFTIMVFIVYDCIVDQYQQRMVASAEKTHAIVRALFPQNVRDRLLRINEQNRSVTGGTSYNGSVTRDIWTVESSGSRLHQSPKFRLRNILNSTTSQASDGEQDSSAMLDEPLADLYPEVTILFADVCGFTAWSSEREPAQVFTLLETLYGAMDKVAKRLGIFKVETIGDCYVAASGLPTARKDHCEIMVKFARMCLQKNRQLLVQLEAALGPGTAELGMRTGLHSGPVTAGILRGEKSRFQLFGDTMNTASRIESTGQKGKVHLSSDAFKYLEEAGKGHWAIPREGKVEAKGKGELQTYWLKLGSDSANSDSIPDELMTDGPRRRHSLTGNSVLDSVLWKTEVNGTDERLIDWNTDVLLSLLGNVVASHSNGPSQELAVDQGSPPKPAGIPLQELVSAIEMPEYSCVEPPKAELPACVRYELRDYVHTIASAYLRNSFHNFEHASHVALSASKLLKRIDWADSAAEGMTMEELHEHTYGITSDALTKFAVVFCALVHDVGHTGVPNAQLAIESPEVAEEYENKCIAEQRSVDIAWDLLMLPRFKNVRSCLFGDIASEAKRFRQLLVNCVLATDIFDPALSALRKDRWLKAFEDELGGSGSLMLMTPEDIDRRATVVVEHIIQASDVSHTMQHWHIYKKWNCRLFREMYAAYKAGRIKKDPADGWYQGELWFFDNYVIPLALKLKECGVFGASGDEYHTYAVGNRDEWASHGEKECQEMLAEVKELEDNGESS